MLVIEDDNVVNNALMAKFVYDNNIVSLSQLEDVELDEFDIFFLYEILYKGKGLIIEDGITVNGLGEEIEFESEFDECLISVTSPLIKEYLVIDNFCDEKLNKNEKEFLNNFKAEVDKTIHQIGSAFYDWCISEVPKVNPDRLEIIYDFWCDPICFLKGFCKLISELENKLDNVKSIFNKYNEKQE